MKPKISYLADSQKKPGYFEDILNEDLLKDICKKTTGQASFDLEVKHGEYNKGRLITMFYF